MAEVRLENISKVYPGEKRSQRANRAVDDISFTIHDKEFMVIVGSSGCGKSTLLRMIAGLEEISEGNLYIDGKRMNDLDPRDRDIAMVFQNYALYPHMSVYENMAFGLRLKNFSKKEIKERVHQVAGMLELENKLDQKPKSLSGGQRQRVAIGRAIIRRPKVFLFDEPLSNLDAKLRSQMRIELQKLHREINATMIYVTHDQVEAMTLGNRIAVLSKGTLMQLDTPLQLYNHPANHFVAGFIGSPRMNFIKGSIKKEAEFLFADASGGTRISLGNNLPAFLQQEAGQSLLLGVRPEHVLILEDTTQNSIPDCTLEVTAYENMGNEQIIYFSISGETLIVRRQHQENIDAGETRPIFFMRDKLIFIRESDGTVLG